MAKSQSTSKDDKWEDGELQQAPRESTPVRLPTGTTPYSEAKDRLKQNFHRAILEGGAPTIKAARLVGILYRE